MKSVCNTPWIAGVLVLAISGLNAHAVMAQAPAAPVVVDAVRLEQLTETISVLGRVVATREGYVAARVSAPVATARAQVGDRVEAGDILIQLDTARLELDRALAEAELHAANAEHNTILREIDLLKQELDRLEKLRGSAAFSRARLDDKVTEIAAAASRAEAASARLERSRVNLRYRATDVADAAIRAPYKGVVVERKVSAGAYVRVGDPVVMMVDAGSIEIEADVPAQRLRGIQPGGTMELEIGDQTYEARLRAIVPMENPMTRTRAVRFEPVDPPDDAVSAIGQSVTIDLPIGAPRDALTVSKDAVTPMQGARMVFRVTKENVVEPVPVILGAALGSRFEVVSGLTDGDLVVTKGNERLRPGQEVQFEPPAGETGRTDTVAPSGETTEADASVPANPTAGKP
ncbi:MAG: efflux RND transporter periplasmic adaptor subunit [Geminicoccaceae bacterium]|nr:efflux RND transporter periplasmic adaptor subunit [Geminicoccaceae bacterium]